MRLIGLTKDWSEEWDKIAYDSDDAWLHHRYDFLKFTEKLWKLESKSFLVEHEKKIIGIFPLQMDNTTKGLGSTFLGPGGHAVSNKVSSEIRPHILREMYKHVVEIAYQNGSPVIEICLHPLAKSSLNNHRGINPLIHYSYHDVSTYTWIADLSKPEDKLFAALSYDARRNIRNANKAGYTIKPLQSVGEIDECYEIHHETYERTGTYPFTKEFLAEKYEIINKKGCGIFLKAIDKNGKTVAFISVGLFKKCALYWDGASRTEHLGYGVNYLLQYQAMLWAKNQGAEWFENGEAFPNISSGKQKGMSVFKRKFGGELHRYFKGKLIIEHKKGREELLKSWLRCTKNYAIDSTLSFRSILKGNSE